MSFPRKPALAADRWESILRYEVFQIPVFTGMTFSEWTQRYNDMKPAQIALVCGEIVLVHSPRHCGYPGICCILLQRKRRIIYPFFDFSDTNLPKLFLCIILYLKHSQAKRYLSRNKRSNKKSLQKE